MLNQDCNGVYVGFEHATRLASQDSLHQNHRPVGNIGGSGCNTSMLSCTRMPRQISSLQYDRVPKTQPSQGSHGCAQLHSMPNAFSSKPHRVQVVRSTIRHFYYEKTLTHMAGSHGKRYVSCPTFHRCTRCNSTTVYPNKQTLEENQQNKTKTNIAQNPRRRVSIQTSREPLWTSMCNEY